MYTMYMHTLLYLEERKVHSMVQGAVTSQRLIPNDQHTTEREGVQAAGETLHRGWLGTGQQLFVHH